jgi:predicted nuclease of restriction endonuclease-like (RecB) superfamily
MPKSPAPASLFRKVSHIIETSRQRAYTAVNSEIVLMYWHIGEAIKTGVPGNEKPEYGKAVIEELSVQLTQRYGKGFRVRNLFNMLRLYEAYPDAAILHTLCAKLSWSHLRKLMYIDEPTQRDFYATMAVNERWSVRVMNERINSMLFERTLISKKPELTIANDLQTLREKKEMSTDLFFRDPYMLDFLDLADTYSERDFESAILHELERFILEMGRDFAFVGRQVRITMNDKDYYIDLLFYHRKLRRLVVVELKLGEFLPEHKGQAELYLNWLDKNERNPDEERPMAVILCAHKDNAIVELLELDKSGIHVAQYYTELPPKKVWQDKLIQAITNANALVEAKNA